MFSVQLLFFLFQLLTVAKGFNAWPWWEFMVFWGMQKQKQHNPLQKKTITSKWGVFVALYRVSVSISFSWLSGQHSVVLAYFDTLNKCCANNKPKKNPLTCPKCCCNEQQNECLQNWIDSKQKRNQMNCKPRMKNAENENRKNPAVVVASSSVWFTLAMILSRSNSSKLIENLRAFALWQFTKNTKKIWLPEIATHPSPCSKQ